MTQFPLSNREISRLLAEWPVGRLIFTREQAGTANPAIIVVTGEGQFFLKQRNPRYADPDQLSYDHAVMRHLARAGLPVFPAVKTTHGARWLTRGDTVYELYPFVEGRAHHPGDLDQITSAGEVLARFHEATHDFTPAAPKPWPRYFDPVARLPEIAEARDLLASGADTGGLGVGEAAAALDYLEAQARGAAERMPDERYWRLPQALVHGDYHPANLRFRGPEVVGVFDFDWVSRQPRLVDVADGLILFCGERPEPVQPADLYSLTQSFTFRPEWMQAFLRPYLAAHPLTPEECACLPDCLRSRWLYMRLGQMHRKVPAHDRLRFLLRDVTTPLEWLDRNSLPLPPPDLDFPTHDA